MPLEEELIQYNEQYYILAASSIADEHTRVLKHGPTFAVFDPFGDMRVIGLGQQGLYHEGTRYVSLCKLRLEGLRPLLLSSTVSRDNAFLSVDLTNPDFYPDGQALIPRGSVHLSRSIFLWKAVFYQRLRIRNYGHTTVPLRLSLHIDADFADIFEVRGVQRERRGRRRDLVGESRDCMLLEYEGLDHVIRQLRVEVSPPPPAFSGDSIRLEALLEPHQEETFFVHCCCRSWPAAEEPAAAAALSCSYDGAFAVAAQNRKTAQKSYCRIHTSNELFNDWLNRSLADLQMMVSETETGPYPDAGVPWFSTQFGRDGIITALESLWMNPQLAAGVLRFLARTQAQTFDAERDAEPGKILHETRQGEMAALQEIPFGCYYGSVDSTPLFVMLAGAYYQRTGDLDFIRRLWPSLELALQWIDRYGDRDGDGFVEYHHISQRGLVHQGWKDSWDSVFHSDGSLADSPIALCEVQGYVYGAKLAASQMLFALGDAEGAHHLEQEARLLRENFGMAFWCEDLSTYALALDGKKRPCRVRTSNAGHALFTGIASPEQARRTAETLLDPDSFSGWGVRTVAATEKGYNPMSYHNGSVWPHDNALVAAGLARYGLKNGIEHIFTGLFDAALYVEFHRLPELFCGFPRRPGESPTLYPVACSPQSWAAASVFSLLQATLGLQIRAQRSQILLQHPLLPEFLEQVEIRDLRVGESSVDLLLRRCDEGVSLAVRNQGPVEVITTK